MLKIKPMQLVKIRWRDIIGDSAWHDPEDVDKMLPATAETVGWLYEKNPEHLKICGTFIIDYNGDVQYGDVNVIPVGCVDNIDIMHFEESDDSPELH